MGTSIEGEEESTFELSTLNFNSLIEFTGKQPHDTTDSL